MNKTYLLVTDAHSNWPEIIQLPARKLLQSYESYFLLMNYLCSWSRVMGHSSFQTQFMKSNGIKHTRCAPYHPASNGAVKRLVQTFKKPMKVAKECGKDLQQALSNFLLTYCSTPHTTTNETAAQLFLNYKLQTRLDLLLPDKDKTVLGTQAQQKQNHDHKKNVMHEFKVGEVLMSKSNIVGAPGVKAVIKKRLGPLIYELKTDTRLMWKRHVDLKGLGTVVNDAQPVTEEEVIIPTWLEERSAANNQNNEPPANVPTEPARRYPYREH